MTNLATHRNPDRKELDRLIPSRALPALLDFWTLCDFIGMRKDRSTRLFAWRGAKNGTFPAPVKLSEARIAWRRDEVEAWLSNRPRAIYSKAKDAQTDYERAEVEPASPAAPERVTEGRRVTVERAPKSCPDCGGAVAMVAPSVYSCTDSEQLSCAFVCVVEGAGDAA